MTYVEMASGEIQRTTTVMLPIALLNQSRELRINRSELFREALKAEIARRKNTDKAGAQHVSAGGAPTYPSRGD